jgi:hypothetical protein
VDHQQADTLTSALLGDTRRRVPQSHYKLLRATLERLAEPDAKLPPSEGRAKLLAKGALVDVAVQVLESDEEDAATIETVAVTSTPLPRDGAVVELRARPQGADERHEWRFNLEEPLVLTGTVRLDPPGPDEVETFARAVAEQLGWPG